MTVPVSRLFDLTGSVNDLLRDHPSSIVALTAHGIDTCCGGDLPLPDAARRAGVSFDRLLNDIEGVLRSESR
jgi:iron-sulfur cluster repair protein YtfE (RIC family)